MEIETLITAIRNSFPESVKIYTEGNCYGFYKILKSVYKNAVAYYNSDHVITRIGDKFYDITGEVSGDGYLEMEKHFSKYLNELENEIRSNN